MAQTPLIDIIPDIAQICRKAPNATLIRALNRSTREFCKQSRWMRFALVGATEIGTQLYSMGSDPDLEIIGLKAVSSAARTGNTRPRALAVSVPTGWLPGQPNGAPMRYAYVPEGQMALNPTPDKVYDLLLTIVVQPTLAANSIPGQLLTRWDRVIKAGALAYLLEVPGQPWTDPVQAVAKMREFQSGINNARADEQRDYQAGTFIARRRPFVVGSM